MLRSFHPVLAFVALWSASAHAQGDYYNRDSGRPTRIEDANPTPRYELELQIAPLRFESLGSGARRWRVEPKLAYGFAPFTDVELRVPYIVVDSPDPETPVRKGVGGVALGALHAFGVERQSWPALALAAEWIAPVGTLSAPIGSYSIKGIATKTFSHARAHVNLAYGTYSSQVSICALPRPINVPTPPGCAPNNIAFDPPCDVVPAASDVAPLTAQCTARSATQAEYGHAILSETLLRHPDDAAARLDGRERAFIVTRLLRDSPSVPLDEHAIAPNYALLVPEALAAFE